MDTDINSYEDAFYKIADELSISARADTPNNVFQNEMLPRIMKLITMEKAQLASPAPLTDHHSLLHCLRNALESDQTAKPSPGSGWNYWVGRIYAALASPQVAAALNEAETILKILDGGGWELHRIPAWDAMTDEANAEQAWGVKRTKAPFCDKKGDRQWSGPTAFKAFERAFKALNMKIATPVQVAQQDDASVALTDEQILSAWKHVSVWGWATDDDRIDRAKELLAISASVEKTKK